jgi:hypothetical protein
MVVLVLLIAVPALPSHAQFKALKKKAPQITQQDDPAGERTVSDAASFNSPLSSAVSSRGAASGLWHVSPSGSNGNDGSARAPLKNLDKAMEKAQPGDRIHVAEGIYSGTFGKGYWHADKPLQLLGGFSSDFSQRDPLTHRTVLQPTTESKETSRKALMTFHGPAGGIVVDGFVFDATYRNSYHGVDAKPEGVASGRLTLPPATFPRGAPPTIEKPCLAVPATNGGGDVTIRNNAFVNCANYAIQGGVKDDGIFLIQNNVFVATRMAAVDVAGKCAGGLDHRGRKIEADCGRVEVADNTFAFTWSRLKDFLDMGNAVQINTKSRYAIHDNIIAFSIGAGITHYRFNDDAWIEVNRNVFFGNKTGDLRYSPESNTDFHLSATEIPDIGLASAQGNVNEHLALPLQAAYVDGFIAAQYNEEVDYDPNSQANQLRDLFGLNKQGTIDSEVSMFGNLYPMEQALELFGAAEGVGAQRPAPDTM